MKISPTTIALVTMIGSYVVPTVTQFLKREHWSSQVKQLIALACSVAVACAAIAITARHDFGLPLAELGGIVFAASQIGYGLFAKDGALLKLVTRSPKAPAPEAPPASPAS